ncbi:MAG: lipase [Leptolyngbya sp. SIO4C5]|nr:lipase [Leptolyngbya sp. SIO4C5]
MDVRICFIGDSFVNGTGDPDCLGWAGRLCRDLKSPNYDLTYYNLGVRRETSEQIAQRWQHEVDYRLPADATGRLVFSFGTNDTTVNAGQRRVELAASLAAAERILTAAQTRHPTLMVGPPAIADAEQNWRTEQLSGRLAELCQTLDIPYLAVLESTARSPVWMADVWNGDGAHPGAAGYSELAQTIGRWSAWQSWWV